MCNLVNEGDIIVTFIVKLLNFYGDILLLIFLLCP